MSSTRVTLQFTGLMAPVFTTFDDSKDGRINLEPIDKYAQFLKAKGIHGVLVNGTSGEGPVLSVGERKELTEKWWKCANKYDLKMMVQIGGAPLPDVLELARHAATLKVHGVLCLPELYFKPKDIKGLVGYLKLIAEHCPSTPFLYYHIPMFTGLNFDMPSFCDLAERIIPNFAGIKYTSNDLHMGSACLKDERRVFLGADTLLSAALILGFDSAIMTTLNIYPDLSVNIMKHMDHSDVYESKALQHTLTKVVENILKDGDGEWVSSMKAKFNKMQPAGFSAGPTRKLSLDFATN